MKSLRVWLLVLMAVLLPLRGALAAAMLCPPAGTGVQAEFAMAQQAHHDGGAHTHEAAGHHAQQDASSPMGEHHDVGNAGPADKCNLCSAFCSVTAVVSGSAAVVEPQNVATVFPRLHAPAASFVSDGEDRPPRTT